MPDATQLAAAAATAAALLTDHCTISAVDPDAPPWTPDGGLPSDTIELYDGPCSLLAPRTRANTTAGADPGQIVARILLLPPDAPTPPPGARVEVSSTAADYTVLAGERRTHEVTQRVRIVERTDTEGVPQ